MSVGQKTSHVSSRRQPPSPVTEAKAPCKGSKSAGQTLLEYLTAIPGIAGPHTPESLLKKRWGFGSVVLEHLQYTGLVEVEHSKAQVVLKLDLPDRFEKMPPLGRRSKAMIQDKVRQTNDFRAAEPHPHAEFGLGGAVDWHCSIIAAYLAEKSGRNNRACAGAYGNL
jgi:hypothetical protein